MPDISPGRITLPPGTPDIMTAPEVARAWNAAAETVGVWARTGKLPAFRTPGGHWRFHRADVEAALNGQDGTS